MWKPESEKKPVCRLTGHQATINDVKFSPDARYIASASFDKSVCLSAQSNRGLFPENFRLKYTISWSFSTILCSVIPLTLKKWDNFDLEHLNSTGQSISSIGRVPIEILPGKRHIM